MNSLIFRALRYASTRSRSRPRARAVSWFLACPGDRRRLMVWAAADHPADGRSRGDAGGDAAEAFSDWTITSCMARKWVISRGDGQDARGSLHVDSGPRPRSAERGRRGEEDVELEIYPMTSPQQRGRREFLAPAGSRKMPRASVVRPMASSRDNPVKRVKASLISSKLPMIWRGQGDHVRREVEQAGEHLLGFTQFFLGVLEFRDVHWQGQDAGFPVDGDAGSGIEDVADGAVRPDDGCSRLFTPWPAGDGFLNESLVLGREGTDFGEGLGERGVPGPGRVWSGRLDSRPCICRRRDS